jgi:two-component system sensor histidine kinase DesK
VLAQAPILVATSGSRDHSGTQIAAAVLIALAAAALHLRHVRAAVRGGRPAGWWATLPVQGTLVYAPWVWLGLDWSSAALPFMASAMLLLPRAWRFPVGFGVPFVANGVVYGYLVSQTGDARRTALEMVYYVLAITVFAFALYGTVRLVRVVNELYGTRTELAQAAVERDRSRLSRDLHDLLGQSLSAISLKGDLALRLLPADPDGAQREIVDLTEVARAALRGTRAIARDEHRVTLREEITAAAALLTAAGIDTSVDVPDAGPALDEAAQEVLAWAVREGTTNVLRHSQARTCAIAVTRAAGTVTLQMNNDGAHRPVQAAGSGLAGLADRAATAGGRTTVATADGHYHLRVELPDAAG